MTSSLSLLWGWAVVFFLLSYFCGAVPFGYLMGKLRGVDLREHGSKNIGATNAVRVLGKKWGLPVFFLDFFKGYLPVCWATAFFLPFGGQFPLSYALVLVLCAISAVLGHTFTCWLKFKGGKGVATAGGVILALFPLAGSLLLLVWVVVFLISRYVSLASICAAFVFPFLVLYAKNYFSSEPTPQGAIVYVGFSLLVAFLIIIKHKSNMSRLLQGTESRAFTKKS